MFRSKLFKLPQHRKFNYTPRHFDADKEELHERLRAVELRQGKAEHDTEDIHAMKKRISLNFREGGGGYYKPAASYIKRANYRSNVILVCTLVGLLVLGYYVLAVTLPKIEYWLQ